MTGRFEGLSVLLTGAAGGFGERTAQRLAAEGANLILSDINEERLDALADTLDANVATLAGDICDEKLSQALVELALDTYGRLDIAINNAGIAHGFAKLHQIKSELARHVFDTDLVAMFYAMKHQLEVMEEQFRETTRGATIVNVASVAGIAGAPRLSVYAAAKHGVVGLTRSAAAEYASKKIRVNAVCPSYARTSMALGALGALSDDPKAGEAELTRGVPMRRLAEVDEVVEVILFAADPNNSFMTGQALAADGGITAV